MSCLGMTQERYSKEEGALDFRCSRFDKNWMMNVKTLRKILDINEETVEFSTVYEKASLSLLYPSEENNKTSQAYLFLMQILMLNSNIYYDVFQTHIHVRKHRQLSAKERAHARSFDNVPQGRSNQMVKRGLETVVKDKDSGCKEDVIHPQDAILLALAACSTTLRAHVYSKLFACKIAMPLITPDDRGLRIHLNAFRDVIVPISDGGYRDGSVLDCLTKIVSFLRFSNDCSISKSKLISELISDTGVVHNIFYNRDCPFASERRRVSNGVVEAAWYLHSAAKRGIYSSGPTMYLNLRGNAQDETPQSFILGGISTVIVAILKIEEESLPAFKDYCTTISSNNVKLVLYLLPGSSGFDEDELKEYQLDMKIIKSTKEDGSLRNSSTIKQELRIAINTALEKGTAIELVQKMNEVSDELERVYKISCTEDVDTHTRKAIEAVELRFGNIGAEVINDRNTHLPLLPIWEEWGSWKKKKEQLLEIDKFDIMFEQNIGKGIQMPAAEWAFSHMTRAEVHMSKCRRLQLETLSRSTTSIIPSIIHLITEFNSHLKVKVFLLTLVELLKGLFNHLSRDTLQGLFENYKHIISIYKESNRDTRILQKLKQAEISIAESSFTMHHVFREIGQIYEALESPESLGHPNIQHTYLKYKEFPNIAAHLLLSGFPLELMDGDAGSIPMVWMRAVLQCVSDQLGDAKVLVISVLGVQSSGKSTLLNAMFGVQFAVSAGRCTRGVYMQLIKMTKRQCFFGDYILILDSEGIRAFDGIEGGIHRDNEIATFVIGLSDLTIMNIKGEQHTDVRDVLQIAVHAFLRMHIHGMTRRCIFVHQNVPATNADSLLFSARTKLMQSLNKATSEAAALEHRPDITEFRQIVHFDLINQTFYFGDIWFGDPPNATTNPRYYQNMLKVVKHIFELFRDTRDLRSVYQLGSDLGIVWKGIESEAFIFRFRNVHDIKAFTEAEEMCKSHLLDMSTYIHTTCYTRAKKAYSKCSVDEMPHMDRLLTAKLKLDIITKMDRQQEYLETLFSKPSNRVNSQEMLVKERKIVIERMNRMVSKLHEKRWSEICTNSMRKEEVAMMMQSINDLVAEIVKTGQAISDAELRSSFDELWKTWMSTSTSEIMLDCRRALLMHLPRKPTLEMLNRVNIDERLLTLSLELNEGEMEDPSNDYVHHKHRKPETHLEKKTPSTTESNTISDTSNRLLADILSYVRSQTNSGQLNKQRIIDNIIQFIDDIIVNHNRLPKNDFTFTSQYQIRLAVQTLRFSIPILNNLLTESEEKDCVFSEREGRRARLFNLYKHLAQKQVMSDGYPSVVAYIVEEYLWEHVTTSIQQKIVSDMSNRFRCKDDVLSLFYDEFARSGTYTLSMFIEILNSGLHLKEECMICFARCVDKTHYATSSPILKEAHLDISRLISIFKRCMASLPHMKKGLAIIDWVHEFCHQLEVEDIFISDIFYSHIDSNLILSDPDVLSQKLIVAMDSLALTITHKLTNLKLENLSLIKYALAQKFNDVWGCNKVCPTCKEPCSKREKHELAGQHHFCYEHRPIAVTGDFSVVPGIMSPLQNCNKLMRFSPKLEEQLKDWDVVMKPLLSTFWQWFLAKHGDELAAYYKCSAPTLPESWHNISVHDAIASVKLRTSPILQ